MHILFKSPLIRFLVLSIMSQGAAYALPFTIKASGTLPTSITKGGTVNATYTITNNTSSMRNSNYIKYLPLNVQQNSGTGLIGDCGLTFNLAPNGQTGDTCTLNLTISGPVNGNDPDPHHHLFACFPGGMTCAGTLDELNVTETNEPPAPPASPRFAYVTQDSSPVIEVCNINATTGALSGCTSAITGSTTGSVPSGNTQGIAFNSTGTIAYLTVLEPTPSNSVFQCDINQTNGTFTSCSQVDITSPTSPNPYYAYYGTPAINSANTYAFFASYYSPNVFACPISNGNVSGSCFDSGVTGTNDYVAQLAFNPANTTLYAANWGSGYGVTTCTGSGRSFNSCHNVVGDAGMITFDEPSGVVVTASGNNMYVADYSGSKVYYCTTSMQTATAFTHCSIATSSISNPWTITLNAAGTVAYITDYHTTVYTCAVNATDGTLTGCNTTTFPEPVEVSLLY